MLAHKNIDFSGVTAVFVMSQFFYPIFQILGYFFYISFFKFGDIFFEFYFLPRFARWENVQYQRWKIKRVFTVILALKMQYKR